jgi:hypothetical protein
VKEDKKCKKVVEGPLSKAKYYKMFLEGGKKYERGKEKGVNEEMGNIIVRSWNTWILDIQKQYWGESEDSADAEKNVEGTG